jgi:hypothetical protein
VNYQEEVFIMARTADQVAPTKKVKSLNKELSRPMIEKQMNIIMGKFFEAEEQSKPVGQCPFCEQGELEAMRLTDSQNENRGGVWCNRCNFRFMI